MTSAAVVEKWEDLKAKERDEGRSAENTILSGVPRTLPALLRAYELSARAAAVGFDWIKSADVVDKIEEEVRELREMTENEPSNAARIEEEMGDLLFSIVNLARKLGIEPEAALRLANEKFQTRFDGMEHQVRQEGRQWRELTLDEMEARWKEQKERQSRV